MVRLPYIRYHYIGKCSDGRYWMIHHNLVRYVVYLPALKRTTIKTFCSLREAVTDRVAWRELPREVREAIRRLLADYLERVKRVREVRRRLTVLTWTLKKVLHAADESDEVRKMLDRCARTVSFANIDIVVPDEPYDLALMLEDTLAELKLLDADLDRQLESTYSELFGA